MPVPKPPAPLGQHCTTLVGDVLYAYTENGFFSLPLSKGGNWTKIEGNQVTTKGAVCVPMGQGTADEALYVLGGQVAPGADKKNPTYNGLQRYVFSQKKWEMVPLQDPTLLNLTRHGAGCMQESNQIFIYGGNWSGEDVPSSMTFLININDLSVTSLPTGAAPPLLYPIVQKFDGHTVVVSGGAGNTHIYSYSLTENWKQLTSTLDAPLPPNAASGTVVQGDDQTKMFITFDFSQSPVDVELIPLFNGTGAASPAAPKLRPRVHDLTSTNWPDYNSTLAPKDTRQNFAIASNNQFVVISGGGPADDPLCIFDFKDSSWLNAANLLASQKVLSDSTVSAQSDPTSTSKASRSRTPISTTARSTNTIQSTPTASTINLASNTADLSSQTQSATAAAGESSGLKTSTQLLFIILGVVLLVALILGTAYIILRCKRKKLKAARGGEKPQDPMSSAARRDSGMSFKDRGASFMKEAGGSKSTMFGTGRKSRSLRGRSLKEELEFVNVGDMPRGAVLGPAAGTHVEMQPAHRGSGWSRYFSGNSTTNLVQNGAGLHRNPSDASRSSYTISEFPDEPDERRQSYPSIGYVRSSYASHSAVFSQDLPTPTFGDVMRDNNAPANGNGNSNPGGNVGLMGFEPPRAPGLFQRSAGSQISVSSAGASSINFFGEAVSHPDFAKKVAHATSKYNPASSGSGSAGIQIPSAAAQARVVSSVYSEDRDSALPPPPGINEFGRTERTDSFGFFGNERQGTQVAPRGDQGLGWFVRD
ncbi:hypothetical protein Dda_5926 [Drechslerella dactyloides]|uniref:Pre-mRNA splicing factor CLF1 n=1 Tax=Drechslerella dactyloides TaxID=74499 RepID=A0AAD6NI09_DREDA|nr:hypothetical protein Dda_5926 [Drechslerella dactyloides]